MENLPLFTGLYVSQVVGRISSINSITCFKSCVFSIYPEPSSRSSSSGFWLFSKADISTSPESMGGRLADGFANLLRSLWDGGYRAVNPSKLRELINEKLS